MVHNHKKHSKSVGIRQFQQNVYKNLPTEDDPLLITNHGQPTYMVSSLSSSAATNKAINILRSFTEEGASNENNS